jgi:hypothetical protein
MEKGALKEAFKRRQEKKWYNGNLYHASHLYAKIHPEQQLSLDISAHTAFFYWFGHFHKLKEIIRSSSIL